MFETIPSDAAAASAAIRKNAAQSLWQAFADGAQINPDAELVVESLSRPARLSIADLMTRGEMLGSRLRDFGIVPGDVVAVQLPAWAEWLIIAIGVAHAGAVLLPIVSIYGSKELGFILRQSSAKLIITPDRWRNVDYARMIALSGPLPSLRRHIRISADGSGADASWQDFLRPTRTTAAAARTPDDPAMLVYTSGTTAEPKGVQHSGRTLLSEIATVDMTRRDLVDERVLSPWPPGHVAGALTMLRCPVAAIPLVLLDQWDPAIVAAVIERDRITSCSFTPFHLNGLLEAAERGNHDLSSLQHVAVGATAVPPSLVEKLDRLGLLLLRVYGLSEMPTVTLSRCSDPLEKRMTTEGRPMPGAELRFVDDDGLDVEEGELAIRGPELFTGYFDPRLDAGAFLPGGWFRTGDIGSLDEDGYLRITDRKKDIIIRGGENISSREVELLLEAHPAVHEASVVGAPDARMGEVVCAFVVPRTGMQPTLDTIRAFFSAQGVAKQKTPERIVHVEDLPRNATGKVLKHELRNRLQDRR